jgi:2-polyprenyl-3-methyl-5-hydroxy-6-metoxy-1,4-benzoquinol methylase
MLYYISGLRSLPKDARIIDCACGSGAMIETLQAEGFQNIDGFDASIEMVELARQNTGKDIKHIEAGQMAETYPHGVYDAVCISNMLHHLEAQAEFDKFLDGCRTLLKPGGIIVIREPHKTLLFRTFEAMSKHKVFYVGFLKSRLNSLVEEEYLLKLFQGRWPKTHQAVLAQHGLCETRAFSLLDSLVVLGRRD